MKKTYLHILVIAIVGIISYSNSFNVPFQFDDYFNISENPIIKDPGNFTSSLSGYQYNPRRYLGYLSLALNYRYGGLDVRGYHIVNLLIHLINATLVYFLVLLTFRTPYFKSEKLEERSKKSEVSSKKEDAGKGPDTDGLSLLTTHYSLFTIPGSRSFVAFFSALLFVAHPIQTQAVTYIVQRFTSLAALFYLLSMVMYIKGRLSAISGQQSAENSRFTIHDSRFTIILYLLSLFSAVLAMKTKEIAFTLPIMILLYEFIFFRSTLKRKLIVLVPILLTLAIIPLSMLHIDKPLGELLSDLSEKSRLQTDMSRGDYLATEMRVIVTYIRLIVFPINQNLDYGYPIYRSFFSPPVFLSFLFLSGLIGTAVYLLYKSRWAATTVSSKKLEVSSDQAEAEGDRSGNDLPFTTHYSLLTIHYSRLIAFGILWFFLALSVESSFIPIVDVIFEHRLYLPSIGAFVALSAALFAAAMRAKSRWPNSERAIIPLVVIIVLILSAATFARNRVWQDKTRLWEDVVRKSPGNARAHNNLCFVYLGNGKTDQAIQQCTAALGLLPDYLDARINLGVAYNARGMYDKAIEHFLIALSMDPDDADAHNNLGIAYVSKGMFDEGIKHYQIAVSLSPDYAEAYSNLGVAYASKGLFDKARENFEYAIRLKPDYFEAYHNLALLYEKMGDYEKAASLDRKAKDMKPLSAP
jgi:tetratricopeptide (TPR) repeat protein